MLIQTTPLHELYIIYIVEFALNLYQNLQKEKYTLKII